MCTQILTNLSVPSVIFAADDDGAVWYGSLRGGVELGGGHDGKFSTTGSRWGIKGSSEVSEGLSAMYKFETRLGSGEASQDTKQLYVGLSGGFGSLKLGKFHNAAYLAGGIRDIGNWYSGGDVNTNAGNTLSYGYAADAFALQVDAIMDGGKDTGKAVDEAQFGLAVNLGDIGKVAIGYEKREDTMKMTPMSAMLDIAATGGKPAMSHKVMEIDVNVAVQATPTLYAGEKGAEKLTDAGRLAIKKVDGKYQTEATACKEDPKTAGADCLTLTALVERKEMGEEVSAAGGGPVTAAKATEMYFLKGAGTYTPATSKTESNNDGYKRTGVSASFGLGGTTVGLGYSSKDSNDPADTMKEKTTYFGVNGSIGDTGMDWRAWGRKVEDHAGMESSPWGAGVGKALGGGAYAWFEHSNSDDGEDGTTHIALNVNF